MKSKSSFGGMFQDIYDAANIGIIILDLDTLQVLEANPEAARLHGYDQNSFSEFAIKGFVHKDSLHLFKDLRKDTLGGQSFNGVTKDVREDKRIIDVEWQTTAIDFAGEKRALMFLRDVTSRVEAENKLRDNLKQQVGEQDSLLRISDAMAASMQLQPDLILDQLRLYVGFSHAALISIRDNTITVIKMQNEEEIKKEFPLHIDISQLETLKKWLSNKEPYRIGELNQSSKETVSIIEFFKEETGIDFSEVSSWLWVPIVAKNDILGGIVLAHSKPNYYTPHHSQMAKMIANKAAMVMVNQEILDSAVIRSASDERQRIARNMHDAVNQSLFSAGLIAEVLPSLYKKDPEATLQSLEDLRHLIRGASAEMRALVAEMRPDSLADRRLSDLLKLLADSFTGRTGKLLDFRVIGQKEIPVDVKIGIYRICQETLNNIARHANAQSVHVNLRFSRKGFKLKIKDDGCGFNTEDVLTSDHYGLAIIKERAQAIQADLEILSAKGEGTEVIVKWKEK